MPVENCRGRLSTAVEVVCQDLSGLGRNGCASCPGLLESGPGWAGFSWRRSEAVDMRSVAASLWRAEPSRGFPGGGWVKINILKLGSIGQIN